MAAMKSIEPASIGSPLIMDVYQSGGTGGGSTAKIPVSRVAGVELLVICACKDMQI